MTGGKRCERKIYYSSVIYGVNSGWMWQSCIKRGI